MNPRESGCQRVSGFSKQRLVKDPTVLFTAVVVITPAVLCDNIFDAICYLLHPTLWLSFGYLLAVLYVTHQGGGEVPLTQRDHRVAMWFLCNGVFFNLFLDVVAGQFQLMGAMSRQYLLVEPRYAFGLYKDAGVSVFMTSMCELFFQSPLSILTYYAYHQGKSYRQLLEITVGILHIAGVWWFYVPEIVNSFPYSGGWPDTLSEAISFRRLLYFWCGYFVFPALWVYVPFQIGKKAWIEINAAMKIEKKH